MSEEKEPSAKGFGLLGLVGRSPAARYLAAKKARKSAIQADKPDDAELEMAERFAQELAQELMSTYPAEQIAQIAARYMIGADVFQRKANSAVDNYRKQISEKRAERVKENKEDAIALARQIAKEKWQEDTEKKIRKGEMARLVYSALQDTNYGKQATLGSVRNWITPVTPDHASRRGR